MEEKNKIYLTQETIKKYEEEKWHLINVERPAVILEIKEARQQGDLSENAEYDAAREKQGQIEDRITELENILSNAISIQESHSDKIGLGSVVRILNQSTGKERTFKIVGSFDTDPTQNKISYESPLAKSIIGFSKGDVVEIDAPDKYTTKILSVNDK
ncbi:transcription elongation factor GreA [Mycoplasmopsis pulmonis]|uniref:Transcription elongation factor GreA n=1 Tax=Mycoplasmopsis pulmonis (strain UAB CTIP) TaxID=272635 RepID=GREA_MYCPU|nr:transcription elongation factor GreA [Mycoplasmopsis pulmonis]Q98Q16.2 RecName: Full=Transcription elongation factor GreA; AltName: Full=Transcript cleavage factor GreA [Mycoplasmopsis pulmonis UAB CTIP]MDZ7293643.1 transcription elongation factor GreA [Mycoplasmopsis pulmonis]VEU68318.1 transcription elongation factor GreA [Mycoplasmopsis pulmonis]